MQRFFVETASGARLVDAHSPAGERPVLRLPGARPLFVRTPDDESEYAIESAGPQLLSALAPKPASARAKGAAHLAFGMLFADSFGSADVASYASRYAAEIGALERRVEREETRAAVQRVSRIVLGASAVLAAVAAGTTLAA